MSEPFKNPIGGFNHEGGYSIEIAKDASVDKLPKGATRQGSIITVLNGVIFQDPAGGFYMHSLKKSFNVEIYKIKAIYKDSGNILWKNKDYDTMD